MKALALGLDGGGTKVLSQAATLDGAVIGRGLAGACNIAFMPLAEALGNALEASQIALSEAGATPSDVRAVCAGVAGTSFSQRRAEFLAALQVHFPNALVTVEPDYAIALTGATEGGSGVIVIAGTGSAAYGENGAGQSHKTGAYGYLIDDGGSGYGVGREAVAAALRTADGTGAPTLLAEHILTALSLASLSELVPGIYGGVIDRVTVASLSRVVADTAQTGDAVAVAILRRAGETLADLVHGVVRSLFANNEPFPIVQIGSLWNAGPSLTDVFAQRVREAAPQSVVAEPRHEPVYGAVLRAIASVSRA